MNDFLEESEEIVVEGPKVRHDDKDYNVYITNNRLILFKRRGFILNYDDFVSWDLNNILNVKLEDIESTGKTASTGRETLIMRTRKEEARFECKILSSWLLDKLRDRIG